MTDTTKLFTLIPVWMTLTFVKVTVVQESRKFCVHFYANFSVKLDANWDAATACQVVKSYVEFISHD